MNVFFKIEIKSLVIVLRMIDTLISDQMKEILINLELYFESNNFLIFTDFLEIFLNFSEFSMNF